MNNTTSLVRSRELPETINIHLTRTCNFGCRYCYAEFAECGSARIQPDHLRRIVEAIGRADPPPGGRSRKVNFAGGEPLLYPELPDILVFSKKLGLASRGAMARRPSCRESRLAWEKASRAFLLVLKARLNWPTKFPIKHCELAPENWRHRVDQWLFGQAADRIGVSPSTLNLSSSSEAESALTSLTKIVSEIWPKEGRSMFWPLGAEFLSHFIIVAAQVHADAARDCLNKLGTALNRQQPDEMQRAWRGLWVVFPVAQEPSLAEALLPAVGSPYFCRAVFASKPNAEAAALLQRITQAGLANERDRRMVMRSLSLRTVILSLIRGGAFAEAAQSCREMAESNDWPATETGRTLQAC